ncbi:inositol monophosphatase family protein [Marinicella rhabdoformis]|uniref:inositol monophosphatase family protein n=1 Tax=Marinicella rhabdoformis TaxID=2580566 RepID=UPI001C550F73|nr:inositol monophosphatase family protein [Marinicella rhabdoformis]
MINKTQDNSESLDTKRLASMLTVAKRAAKAAEQVIKKYYLAEEQGLEIKSDATPVTLADKECERVIRSVIEQSFPEHGIFGEELGRSDNEDSDFLWLIDPIDGTKSFVRGYGFFSTQIALMYQGELVLGVSNAPIYGEMAWAYQGGGAFLNNKPIKVNNSFEAHSACISSGNIHTLVKDKWQQFGQLLLKFGKTRGYGDFCHYHLLASGKIDLVVESDVNILDIAALTVIVREAGGVMTDINGHDINLDTRNILAGGQKAYALGLETLHE